MAERELVGWVQSAMRAAPIVEKAEDRREGMEAAARSLGVSVEMIRKQLDLLQYVSKHVALDGIRASQTKLEIFRAIERADPIRGAALRDRVLADRLTARELQLEFDEAKLTSGLREPVELTLEEVYDQCRRDLPMLDRLRPPVSRASQGDALWIGADLDWTYSAPDEESVPTWCAMVSPNIACSRLKRTSFYNFAGKVIEAGARYEAVSAVLASQPERQLLETVLAWASKKVRTAFFLHVVGDRRLVRMGRRGDPFAHAAKNGAVAPAAPTGRT